ncbi:MAG TPA: DinB family protein [Acidimicrobiales bacterium]
MSAPLTCDGCGFRWDDVRVEEMAARLTVASERFVDVVRSAGPFLEVRPSPQRWSILEYGSHFRDVLISIRERIITAAIVDSPTGVAMNRDERMDRGLYQHDTPTDVALELSVLTRLLTKTLASLPESAFSRTLTYSAATPYEVTIHWAGAQAVHEAEHHLGDVHDNLKLLSPPPD